MGHRSNMILCKEESSHPLAADSRGERLVSVVTCVHNAREYLRPAVLSMLGQSHRNLELIVVDDGSSDGSLATIADLKDPRILRLRQEHAGKAVALNRALELARGELLAMQDADDFSAPDRIRTQVQALLENPEVAGVFTGYELLVGDRRVAPQGRARSAHECARMIADMKTPAFDATGMYRRALVGDYRFAPELPICQVCDYILQVGESHPLMVIEDCLYTYRFHWQSNTKRSPQLRQECEALVEQRALARRKLVRLTSARPERFTNRVIDNNLAADFIESVLTSRARGRRARAIRTGLGCLLRHPLDPHYHKSLVYALLPRRVLRTFRSDLEPRPALPGTAPGSRRGAPTPRLGPLCLMGCAPDAANPGTSALCYSTLAALDRESPGTSVTVFDAGQGLRWGAAWDGERALAFSLCGARSSGRLHESETYWNIRLSGRWGGLGNPGAEVLCAAQAALDASQGDGFSDLGGRRRFRSVIAPKDTVLELGIPLILLPQSYGPFGSPRARRVAARILRAARMAWARDARSFENLKELLGDAFDPRRHRRGVDLAFGLGSSAPRMPLSGPLASWLSSGRDHPVVGLDLSGLSSGPKDDHRQIMARILARLLEETSARIVLVPDPGGRPKAPDAGLPACAELYERFEGAGQGRLAMLGDVLDPFEFKSIVGRLDWFLSTRVHAAIAALSSGVPSAAIACERETVGAFESCGQERFVADLRQMSAAEACECAWRSWCERGASRQELFRTLPNVFTTHRRQMRAIVEACAWSR